MAADKLNWKALAAAFSLTWASFIVMLGLAAALTDWSLAAVEALGDIYLGFGPSLVGTLIGVPWALLDGAIAGALIGLLYNYFRDRL